MEGAFNIGKGAASYVQWAELLLLDPQGGASIVKGDWEKFIERFICKTSSKTRRKSLFPPLISAHPLKFSYRVKNRVISKVIKQRKLFNWL